MTQIKLLFKCEICSKPILFCPRFHHHQTHHHRTAEFLSADCGVLVGVDEEDIASGAVGDFVRLNLAVVVLVQLLEVGV